MPGLSCPPPFYSHPDGTLWLAFALPACLRVFALVLVYTTHPCLWVATRFVFVPVNNYNVWIKPETG